jgi:hypothetical protein
LAFVVIALFWTLILLISLFSFGDFSKRFVSLMNYFKEVTLLSLYFSFPLHFINFCPFYNFFLLLICDFTCSFSKSLWSNIELYIWELYDFLILVLIAVNFSLWTEFPAS